MHRIHARECLVSGFNLESQAFVQHVLGYLQGLKLTLGNSMNPLGKCVKAVAPFDLAVLRNSHPNGDGTPPYIVNVQYSLAFAKHWLSIVGSIAFFSP